MLTRQQCRQQRNCMNYDFGANWHKIVPLLTTINKKCIMDKLVGYLNLPQDRDWYNISPVENLSFTFFNYFLFDMANSILNNRDNTYLTYYDRQVLKEVDDKVNIPNFPVDIKILNVFWRVFQRLKQTPFNYKLNPHQLTFYVPFGQCHGWNKIFGLWLAKQVLPQYKWRIRTSARHTTVYCREQHMVFDILYWGLDHRLKDYHNNYNTYTNTNTNSCTNTNPNIYSSKDVTLGGNLAFDYSNDGKYECDCKTCRKEYNEMYEDCEQYNSENETERQCKNYNNENETERHCKNYNNENETENDTTDQCDCKIPDVDMHT